MRRRADYLLRTAFGMFGQNAKARLIMVQGMADNMRRCSCYMCVSGTRKDEWATKYDKMTNQEKRFLFSANEQESEITI